MVSNTNIIKRIIGIVMLAVSFLAILMMAGQTVTSDIWYDEVFSVSFAKMGIVDLIKMTGRDVHPPMYYIYLKFFAWLGTSIFGTDSYITICKIASIVPWIGLFAVSVTYIRKKWNEFVSGLFVFLVTLMPQISNYYVEIRMYSFALLLITICGLAAHSIYKDSGNTSKCVWCVFFLSGILTAYTQYYACIGIIGIYAGLLLVISIDKKEGNRKILGKLIICAILSVLFYLPWLPVMYRQFTAISGSYWIQPLTLRSIAGCVKFIILPISDKTMLCYCAAGLMLAVLSVLFVLTIYTKKKMTALDGIIFIMPLIIVILSGFVLSALGTPIFIYRYMIPVLGLLWLFVAILFEKVIDKLWIILIMLVPFLLSGILTCRGFYLEEHKKVNNMPLVEEAFNELSQGASIITNFDHVAAISGYYLPEDKIYIYEGEIDSILSDMLNGSGEYINTEGISQLLDEGKDVYFFGSFNSREDIIADWNDMNISAEEMNSVLLERYWFNIYRLEKK